MNDTNPDVAGEAADSLQGVIARIPLASIGIVAGAGLLLRRSKAGPDREGV